MQLGTTQAPRLMQFVAEMAISGMGLGRREAVRGYRVAVRRRGSLVGRRNEA